MSIKLNDTDIRIIVKLLQSSQKEVKQYAKKVLKQHNYNLELGDGYLYAEGNLPIVLLAHMDTVFNPTKKRNLRVGDNKIVSTNGLGADDRAGVFGILKLVSEGYRPHILLLEDEEIGGVGAYKFVNKSFNIDCKYMIELDRKGHDDAVFYDCVNQDFIEYICKFGFREDFGSFTDISIIAPAYDVCAVNLSVGYYNQHTNNEYLVISELEDTLNKVTVMLDNQPDNKFKYMAYSDFDQYQRDYDRYYNNEDIYAYGLDGYEMISENMCRVYSTVYGKYINALEAKNCFLYHNDGIERIETSNSVFIGEDDEIYTYDGEWIPNATLCSSLDYVLYYSDFVYMPLV